MDMDRKLTPEEVAVIVEEESARISAKLETGALLIPKLIKAAFEFYQWLTIHGKLDQSEGESRDVIAEMMLAEMKKRAE